MIRIAGYLGTTCAELSEKFDELNRKLNAATTGTEASRRIQRDMQKVAAAIRKCNAGEQAKMPNLESEGFAPQISGPVAPPDYFDYRPIEPPKPVAPKEPPIVAAPKYPREPFLVPNPTPEPWTPLVPIGPSRPVQPPIIAPLPSPNAPLRMGRLPIVAPPPRPNLTNAIIADLFAREKYLCDFARLIREAAAILEKIDAERDAATDPKARRMLQERSNIQSDKIHAAREHERILTAQAKAIREKLALLDSPILLADPCGLWTDEDVPLQFGARSYFS